MCYPINRLLTAIHTCLSATTPSPHQKDETSIAPQTDVNADDVAVVNAQPGHHWGQYSADSHNALVHEPLWSLNSNEYPPDPSLLPRFRGRQE